MKRIEAEWYVLMLTTTIIAFYSIDNNLTGFSVLNMPITLQVSNTLRILNPWFILAINLFIIFIAIAFLVIKSKKNKNPVTN